MHSQNFSLPPFFTPPRELELSLKLIQQGQLKKALNILDNLAQTNPQHEEVWKLLSLHHQDITRRQWAERQFDLVSNFNQRLLQCWQSLIAGNVVAAESICRGLLADVPGEYRAFWLMAKIAIASNNFELAVKILKICLDNMPRAKYIGLTLIETYIALRLYTKAEVVCDEFLAEYPEQPDFLVCKAQILIKKMDFSEAEKTYKKLLNLHDNKAQCLLRIGTIKKIVGDIDSAKKYFHQAVELSPDLAEAYWSLSNIKTYTFNQNELNTIQSNLANSSGLQRVHYLFALGRIYEEKEQFKISFKYYSEANQTYLNLRNTSSTIDFSAYQNNFTKQLVSQKSECGIKKQSLIFIVGLPRSGTTLIEQILSSHSQVDATMELQEIPRIYNELLMAAKIQKIDFKLFLNNLSKDDVQRLANAYLQVINPMRVTGQYVIDKLPANFQYIGLIKLLFPDAKIIEVVRHSKACAWSLFRQFFAEGHLFSYDLEMIAQYQSKYRNLMSYWHRLFADSILTVEYEELIATFDMQLTKLLAFLNLEIEEQCHQFYKNIRPVVTASSEQVRLPLYDNAVDHWKNYSEYLGTIDLT
jgi:tetratricopeptide (TPR) repeat protein